MSNKYQFMSLGSNCADILFLGPNRIKGPVDNIVILDAYILKYLIENTYLAYIKNKDNFYITKRGYGKAREKDPDNWFEYKYCRLIHNDPREEKYLIELKKRVNAFNTFLDKVKTKKTFYFTFCLNEAMVDTKTHTLKDKTLYYICNYLKSINLLDKVIFVQLHSDNIAHGGYANCYIKEMDNYKLEYNLKVIDLYSEKVIDSEKLTEQFNTKVKEVLKHDK